MKWLLWKDFRHNRLIVFAALGLLLGPYLYGIGVKLVGPWCPSHTNALGQTVYWTPPSWQEIFRGASAFSLFIAQLAVALISGNAIAGERVDRSAEFLYSLPIRREKLLVSKLLLAFAIALVVILFNVPIFMWCLGERPLYSPGDDYDFIVGVATFLTTSFTFFGVAWFFSVFTRSPAISVSSGLIAPLFVTGAIAFLSNWYVIEEISRSSSYWFQYWYIAVCLTLSIAGFVVGTWHYLRRVEP
jgi:ABC-type transport system involved in multi-copper enzyme maturation permease subunit